MNAEKVLKKKKPKKKPSPNVKKQRMNYSREQMEKAVADVKNGMSCSNASKLHDVPRITLLYRVQGKYKDKKCGRESYLTLDEEKILVDWIVKIGKAGFPITKNELLDSVQRLVKNLKIKFPEREFPFIDDRPGRHWYESFLKRHPEISVRTPQNLTGSRSNVTEKNLRLWHEEISNYLKENNLSHVIDDPNRVFNADEAAFFLNPKGNKVLFSKGEKCVYSVVNNNEKECLTTMVCGNANGEICPSMVVYQYERVPHEIVEQMPSGWGIGRSENGWMTSAIFFEFISNIFHPWLVKKSIEFPVILFVDGHSSHLSLHTSEFCQQNGIILVALYPNATHLIQPMDVAVFRTLKSAWREQVHFWRQKCENVGKEVKKKHFAPLLEKAIQTVKPDVLKNGFKKCGLYPWDVEAINYKQNPSKEIPVEATAEKEIKKNGTEKNNKYIVSLDVLEEEIGDEKLSSFRFHEMSLNWEQEVDLMDHNLFLVWKNMKKKAEENVEELIEFDGLLPVINEGDLSLNNMSFDFTDLNCDTHEIVVGLIDNEEVEIIVANTKDDITKDENTKDDITKDENTKDDNTKDDNTKDDNTKDDNTKDDNTKDDNTKDDSTTKDCIPSPFKRALFYPDNKTSKKRRTKEKIPFCVSSDDWQAYYKKKECIKKEQENMKNERAKQRKERAEQKAKQQQMMSEKRKKKKDTTDSASEGDDREGKEDGLETTNETRMNLSDIPLNAYVVVIYEEEYFPGVVLEKVKNGAKVKVMTMAGVDTWKWPEKDDILFYLDEDIIKVIKHPELRNARGHYFVSEINKIREKRSVSH